MKHLVVLCLFIISLLAWTVPASAQIAFVRVTDASQLAYQTGGGNVYLRNVNTFDSNALPCCYSYWIDTTTPEGKNIFALLLTAIAQGQGLWIGLPSGYASGAVTDAGNW
jgi:hypothetical protein